MPRRILSIGLFLFAIIGGLAQNESNDYLGTWTMLQGHHQVDNKIKILTIGAINQYETFHHYQFLFASAGVSYALSPNFSATVGYAYLDSEPFVIDENERGARQDWVYGQITHKLNWRKCTISNRLRTDNRWIQVADGTILEHRARYRLQLVYPITDLWYTRISNEIFVHLQNAPFDQNRLLVGLGYKVTPSLQIETGYLKHHFAHIVFDRMCLGVILKTDFRKKRG